jgi:hypothetical protein
MGEAPSAFPLSWPMGKPRTPWQNRVKGHFTASEKAVSRSDAMKRLEQQLALLGAIYPIVSSDMELRRDGQPHLGRAEPSDPGVCVYFQLDRKPYAMACDKFDRLAQNLAAIAQHIEATRRIERYGVATAAETLQAFQALPAPAAPRSCWQVLGLAPGAAAGDIQAAFRRLSADRHPDRPGGSHDAMSELTAARETALKGAR